ncbi:MAG TPA: hypothetical protein PLU87_19020 [Sedimentisphaerales bacterium]|nr:hypothetical protein [Sedimentisphaerales bacterium]
MDKINSFLQDVAETHNNTVEVAKRLLDGKENIVVTFQKPVQKPVRREPEARGHWFTELTGFIAYLKTYGDPHGLVVLANAHTGHMQAVLDELDTEGREIIDFAPMKHPLFAPWRNLLGTAKPIHDIAKFILGNHSVVIDPDPKLLYLIFSQIKVNATVEAQQGAGKTKTNGLMVTQTIKGKVNQEIVEIPETITIRCPLFVGDEGQQDITFDVCVDAKSPESQVCCTLTSPDVVIKTMVAVKAMFDKVKEALPNATVGYGTIQYHPWSYLK